MPNRDNTSQSRDSVVNQRSQHFWEEKRFLADAFGGFLLERLKSMDVDKVILFIDAGSTLQPLLGRLAKEANELKRRGDRGGADWIDNIAVVTNNFSGFQMLLDKYIDKGEKRNLGAEIALRVVLLPGRILPAYDAIVGFENRYLGETLGYVLRPLKPYRVIQDIRRRVEERNQDGGSRVKIISLVTGNWIRISESNLTPVPLARGAGHLAIKREMMAAADEVYVIAPLGKIFIQPKKEVGRLLNVIVTPDSNAPPYLPKKSSNTYKHSYKEFDTQRLPHVYNDIPPTNKIKLVTTARVEGAMLEDYSNSVRNKLDAVVIKEGGELLNYHERTAADYGIDFSVDGLEKVKHLMFEFEPLKYQNEVIDQWMKSESLEDADEDFPSYTKEDTNDIHALNKLSPNSPRRIWKELKTDFPHKATRVGPIFEAFKVDPVKVELSKPRFMTYHSTGAGKEAFIAKVWELRDIAEDREAERRYYDDLLEHFDDELKQPDPPAPSTFHLIVAQLEGEPIGWGAFKEPNADLKEREVEIKMMYTRYAYRFGSVADTVLSMMEKIIRLRKYHSYILKARRRQESSIEFYAHNGCVRTIEDLPEYTYTDENKNDWVWMRKKLNPLKFEPKHLSIRDDEERYRDTVVTMKHQVEMDSGVKDGFFDHFSSSSAMPDLIVSYVGEELVGWAAFEMKSRECEITLMYIRPEYRQIHFGKKIIARLEEYVKAKGISSCFLQIKDLGPAYADFFIKYRYVQDKRRIGSLIFGSIESILRKELD